MNRSIIKLVYAIILLATAIAPTTAGNDQKKGNHKKESQDRAVYISALVNNGKILSGKGVNAIKDTDVLSIRVSNDTVFLELKKDSFKRIDKDRSNYKIDNKTKKSR